jgi:hypothetical protein
MYYGLAHNSGQKLAKLLPNGSRRESPMFTAPYLLKMYWNRFLYRLTGRRPRLGAAGCAQFYGYEKEGGFYYITSPDFPGFRATLAPTQLKDIPTLTNTLEPALEAYLKTYFRAQHAENRIRAEIYGATLPRHGRSMNLVAEFCTP